MRDLSPLLNPRSVAVVGASANLASPAGKPVRFLRDAATDVTVYPVNPAREEIAGYRAYPDAAALPQAPDVGIVVVPTDRVVDAVTQLAERGTRAAIVVTSGFAEGGGDGVRLQREIRDVARAHEMLLLGPNTLGVHDYVRGLPLSFVWYGRRAASNAGSVAVVSQSGSGMTSLCDRLLDAGLPLGHGIATGNEADVTVTDAIEHLAEDPRVKLIVTVFEEIRDGAHFLRVCQRLRELGKPLIALKVGRTASGSEMVLSHTGALAGSYPTLSALLRQYGVIEVTDVDHIAAMAASALPGKLPTTDGIAVVTNSGGAAAMAADRADDLGVRLAVLGPEAQERIRENLPAFARGRTVHNPVDITAQNKDRPYAMVDIAASLVADSSVGGVIVAVASGGGPDGVRWSRRLIDLVRDSQKPVVTVLLSGDESAALRHELIAGGVPVMSSPSRAVEVLSKLSKVSLTPARRVERTKAVQPIPVPPPAHERGEFATLRWLAECGVPVARQIHADTPAVAASAAAEVGLPVAVKVNSPDIAHKTEVGGVVLGCTDADAVQVATSQILAAVARNAPTARIDGVTVTPMYSSEFELIVGLNYDRTFGHVALLGLGGIWAEIIGDVTMRGVPLTDDDVERMVEELHGAALLHGARGRTPVDMKALATLLRTLVDIAEAHGDLIRSIDLNPVAVKPDGGLVVLDAAVFTT